MLQVPIWQLHGRPLIPATLTHFLFSHYKVKWARITTSHPAAVHVALESGVPKIESAGRISGGDWHGIARAAASATVHLFETTVLVLHVDLPLSMLCMLGCFCIFSWHCCCCAPPATKSHTFGYVSPCSYLWIQFSVLLYCPALRWMAVGILVMQQQP